MVDHRRPNCESAINKGMRVLDLGCGKGLTSVFLAEEFGVQVFAVDLWTTATENYNRLRKLKPILKEDAVVAIAFPGME